MTAPGIEWDEQRGRYVNRALEAVQARHALAGRFRDAITGEGDLVEVAAAALEHTPATLTDVVAALVLAAQDAAHNGDTESEQVGGAVADLLAEWLKRAAGGPR